MWWDDSRVVGWLRCSEMVRVAVGGSRGGEKDQGLCCELNRCNIDMTKIALTILAFIAIHQKIRNRMLCDHIYIAHCVPGGVGYRLIAVA